MRYSILFHLIRLRKGAANQDDAGRNAATQSRSGKVQNKHSRDSRFWLSLIVLPIPSVSEFRPGLNAMCTVIGSLSLYKALLGLCDEATDRSVRAMTAVIILNKEDVLSAVELLKLLRSLGSSCTTVETAQPTSFTGDRRQILRVLLFYSKLRLDSTSDFIIPDN